MAAYVRYAGKVPPLSMQILAYMALVSIDADERPWYGEGHHALAEHAMGRLSPNESDLRAVRRAVTPLIAAGAVTVDRKGAARAQGPSTVRYRLNLKIGDVGRKPSGVASVDDPCEPTGIDTEDPPHRTESGADIGRKVAAHRTESGGTQDGNRPPKEPRGTRRSEKTEEEITDLRTDLAVARAREAVEDPISPPDVEPNHNPPAPLRLIEGNPNPPADPTVRGLWPAAVPEQATPAPTTVAATRAVGFCLACYTTGAYTLAVDPIAGDACAHHLRSTA